MEYIVPNKWKIIKESLNSGSPFVIARKYERKSCKWELTDKMRRKVCLLSDVYNWGIKICLPLVNRVSVLAMFYLGCHRWQIHEGCQALEVLAQHHLEEIKSWLGILEQNKAPKLSELLMTLIRHSPGLFIEGYLDFTSLLYPPQRTIQWQDKHSCATYKAKTSTLLIHQSWFLSIEEFQIFKYPIFFKYLHAWITIRLEVTQVDSNEKFCYKQRDKLPGLHFFSLQHKRNSRQLGLMLGFRFPTYLSYLTGQAFFHLIIITHSMHTQIIHTQKQRERER